jgi:hypothetical protein
MRVRVLMLVSNEFRPEPRVLKEARTLVRHGHSVAIYAWDRERSGLPERDSLEGIDIVRLRFPGKYGTGFRQTWGYLRFYSEILRRMPKGYDVLHCHEVDLLPLGVLLGRCLDVPLICDMHELYSMVGQGAVFSLKGLLEKILLHRADAVICVNEYQKQYYGLRGVPCIVLPNYPEASLLDSVACPKPSEWLTVGYIGHVRNSMELLGLMHAAQELGYVRVLIAGAGPEASKVKEYASGFSRVEVLGPFKYSMIPDLYSRVDCVFAMYGDDRNSYHAMPVKLWESLYTGRPVIVASDTEAGAFVRKTQVGVDVERSTAGIIAGLERLRGEFQTYSHRAMQVGRTMTWESNEHYLVGLYAHLEGTQAHKVRRRCSMSEG